MRYIPIQIYYMISYRRIRDAKARIKATRKSATIVSGLCCPIECADHLETLGPHPFYVLRNFDETSCTQKKLSTDVVTGVGEVIAY